MVLKGCFDAVQHHSSSWSSKKMFFQNKLRYAAHKVVFDKHNASFKVFSFASFSSSSRDSAAVSTPPPSSLKNATSSAATKYSLVQKGLQPTFHKVPFIKEDLQMMMNEVPEFKYYMIGNESARENIYSSIPLDQPINSDEETAEMIEKFKPQENEKFEFSQLENGLKIASLDRKGLTSSLGLFIHCGSRFEEHHNFGACHMLENMAFYSTAHLSWLRTAKTVESLGAQAICNVGREHMVYSAECLREFVPILIPILTGNVLFPRFLRWEMKSNKQRLIEQREKLEKTPDALITELLHTTAWHNNTLGHRLYATDKSLANYNGDYLKEFMLQHFSPDRMVFVGINVEHEVLTKWLMRAFVDYNAIPSYPRTVSAPKYTGGDCRHEADSPLAHLAIAFETKNGWNSEDLVPLTILQTFMGGGGSFSTGGPGKGMHTRLFLNVLNRNEWVENCVLFNTQYTDSGLFGIYMTAYPSQGKEMVRVIAEELKKMQNISSVELKRAKNALKSSIWMNLECRSILMEDVARQLLMSGKIVVGADFCAAIDAVSEADLKRVAAKVTSGVPTVVAYGDISTVPHYNDICDAIRKA